MTSWRHLIVGQKLADLHRAIDRQFRYEGVFQGPPRSVIKVLGRALECFDDGDLNRAERFCSVTERRIIEETIAFRSDPLTWLAQQHTEATT